MTFEVRREKPDGIATLGKLYIDGVFECFTLEPPDPIPAGTYPLTINWSIRFGRTMPQVCSVPGHTGIRIHWGNWRKDTEDCTLVGTTEGKDFIGHSVDEFNRLYDKIFDTIKAFGPQLIIYQNYIEQV